MTVSLNNPLEVPTPITDLVLPENKQQGIVPTEIVERWTNTWIDQFRHTAASESDSALPPRLPDESAPLG